MHIDHPRIRYLINKHITNGLVTRWFLLLQEFDVTIIDKPRKDNIVMDFLSILTNDGDTSLVEDSFPNENLFTLSTHILWYACISTILFQEIVHTTSLLKNKNTLLDRVLDIPGW